MTFLACRAFRLTNNQELIPTCSEGYIMDFIYLLFENTLLLNKLNTCWITYNCEFKFKLLINVRVYILTKNLFVDIVIYYSGNTSPEDLVKAECKPINTSK
jgi:hypothetical protein